MPADGFMIRGFRPTIERFVQARFGLSMGNGRG